MLPMAIIGLLLYVHTSDTTMKDYCTVHELLDIYVRLQTVQS